MNQEPVTKKLKIEDCEHDDMLSYFIKWMMKEGFNLSTKIKLSSTGSCARIGAIALQDIERDDVLFTIPRASIFSETNCAISGCLSTFASNDESGWAKLIISLMYEYTVIDSKWEPYMKFLPPPACMDQPMFWTKEERATLLTGTGLDVAVDIDEKKIAEEYEEVALPFIQEHQELLKLDPKIHSLKLYRHMTAFVMAYSFLEPNEDGEIGSPIMVPLADALNHVSDHNAELEFGPDVLIMRAIKSIPAGQEIYNTYGQISNYQLLQMYGFVEVYPNNFYDTVDIKVSTLLDTAKNILPCIEEKKTWLEERNLNENFLITFGLEGGLSDQELRLLIKVLPMTQEEFKQFEQDDDWSSSDDDDDENDGEFEMVTYSKMNRMNKKLKRCFEIVANSYLERFHSSPNKKAKSLLTIQAPDDLDNPVELHRWREARSLSLIEGQEHILARLIDAVAN